MLEHPVSASANSIMHTAVAHTFVFARKKPYASDILIPAKKMANCVPSF
jgi:hypothetical protein